jgi:CRP-like cAMP-binding protein
VSTRLHGELAALGTPTREDSEVFEIRPPPKIRELSERARTTRETASRALADLEQRGFLKRGRTIWTIIVPADTAQL